MSSMVTTWMLTATLGFSEGVEVNDRCRRPKNMLTHFYVYFIYVLYLIYFYSICQYLKITLIFYYRPIISLTRVYDSNMLHVYASSCGHLIKSMLFFFFEFYLKNKVMIKPTWLLEHNKNGPFTSFRYVSFSNSI